MTTTGSTTLCVCGQPIHIGTVLQNSAQARGIVERINPIPRRALIQSFDVAMLASETTIEDQGWSWSPHIGARSNWRVGVGAAVECKTVSDIPASCSCQAPACESNRILRDFARKS